MPSSSSACSRSRQAGKSFGSANSSSNCARRTASSNSCRATEDLLQNLCLPLRIYLRVPLLESNPQGFQFCINGDGGYGKGIQGMRIAALKQQSLTATDGFREQCSMEWHVIG